MSCELHTARSSALLPTQAHTHAQQGVKNASYLWGNIIDRAQVAWREEEGREHGTGGRRALLPLLRLLSF